MPFGNRVRRGAPRLWCSARPEVSPDPQAPARPVDPSLARFVRTRDAALREELILRHAPLVRYLAARFAGRGVPLEDLIQVGTLGLIRALDRYDPQNAAQFATYAVHTITGEIQHYFRDCHWLVAVPRPLKDLSQRLMSASETIERRTGRAPSLAELAAHLGISEEKAAEALEVSRACAPVALDDAQEDPDGNRRSWFERLGERDEQYERVELRETLHQALGRLPERLRRLLVLRYFEGQSQGEIGRQFGVSQMQISRLEREALERLRADLHSAFE